MKSQIAVNLGCGTTIAPGWINFDNSPNLFLSKIPFIRWALYRTRLLSKSHYEIKWSHKIHFRNLTKPLPFKDSTVDYIYSSHFIEHISLTNANRLFKEIYRVLQPNGIARIVIPDLQYYIEEYLINIKNVPTVAADIFMKNLNVISKSRDPHLWMYDKDSIMDKLKKIGFSKVLECKYQESNFNFRDIHLLDNRPLDSLFIEIKK